jgi:hypothetical protein
MSLEAPSVTASPGRHHACGERGRRAICRDTRTACRRRCVRRVREAVDAMGWAAVRVAGRRPGAPLDCRVGRQTVKRSDYV